MSVKSSSEGSGLPDEVRAINVGLGALGEAVRDQGAIAVDVEWRIPAGGRGDLIAALTRLRGTRAAEIDRANEEVVRRLDESAPRLVGVGRAVECVPGMGERTLLHPGPPLPWEEFCDPLRRSVRAVVVAEGWADSPEEAGSLIDREEVSLEPANDHDTVVPMATALGPTSPVLIVENPQGGTVAYSGINQGPGRRAWFGVDAPEAVECLEFLREVAAPLLDTAIRAGEPLDVFSLASQGLQMGDDAHMRSQASTNLTIRFLLPRLAGLDDPRRVDVARFLSDDHLFFLNIGMAAAKAAAMWAGAVPGASVVTSMARNGTTFGVRLAGMGERWYVAPAPAVEDALFHGDYGPADAAPDIGDSAILELVGLGGPAAAASPAVAAFVGGSMADVVATTREMERICVGRSGRFKLPYLDFVGSPLGVDVRRVVESGVTPSINTGILHGSEGVGQVGAGVAHAPIELFQEALLALDAHLSGSGA